MVNQQLLLFQIVLLSWPIMALAQPPASTNCISECGNVTIPFPFGIGNRCSIDGWHQIDCNSSKPFITVKTKKLQVLDISLDGTMRVNFPVYNICDQSRYSNEVVDFDDMTPFVFSQSRNRFHGVGCGKFSLLATEDSVIAECSTCNQGNTNPRENSCQAEVSSSIKRVFPYLEGAKECNHAFLVDQQWFETNIKNPQDVRNLTHVPVVLDWSVFKLSFDPYAKNKSGYGSSSSCEMSACSCISSQYPTVQCKCFPGYRGNPYLLQGCQDIDECKENTSICGSNVCINSMGSYICNSAPSGLTSAETKHAVLSGTGGGVGMLLLILAVWWLVIRIKKRREIKLKEKYFRQNGGLRLQQQLTSSDGRFDRSTLFDSKDLDKATDHFNVNRILGQGGQGTVYKGMLSDGKIVAVKKSKVSNEDKVDEFINEVVILSKINHRNVVKLLGCCLESEVPLLVYEFVPNGTLSEYLHDRNDDFSLTWDCRLRIAAEIAGALYYLHSAASIPIYHRDIKSTNILLDEKYRAKVADFGTSKSIAIDQTHVTTKVLGTFGYLDPEYFQSNQFTDKSDVYSFGVVLVELLTGQKAISSARSEEGRSLAAYFIISMEDNRLYDILDAQVIQMGKREEIKIVANLAKSCLHLNGRQRPTMKEVAMELEAIRASPKDISMQQNYEEMEYVRTEIIEQWDGFSTSTGSTFIISSPSKDVEPLLANKRSL